MTEKDLVILARAGDKSAFCSLYELQKDRLYRYALYVLCDEQDAQDAVQDCVLSAFSQISQLKKSAAFHSWIFRILYCSCTKIQKNQIEKRKQSNIEEIREIGADQNLPLKTELQNALLSIDEREREVVLLSVIAGYTSREIAKITGLSPAGVRTKQARALEKLRVFLKKE